MRSKILSYLIISALLIGACSRQLPSQETSQTNASPQVNIAPPDVKSMRAGRIIVQFRPEMTKGGDLNTVFLSNITRGVAVRKMSRLVSDDLITKIADRQMTRGGLTRSQAQADQEYLKRQFAVELDVDSIDATVSLLGRLNQDPRVLYAEPDYVFKPSATPNDTNYGSLWALPKIQAPQAWDISSGNNTVVIAVIDTGIDYNHPDLQPNILYDIYSGNVKGKDFKDNDDDPSPSGYEEWHGTHVAGIIAASGNNGLGVTGVNWYVKLMPLRFMNAVEGSSTGAVQAVDYAIANGAHVINASWGGTGYSTTLRDAIIRARNAGILFVAAAGNEGRSNDTTPTYPASFDLANVLSVAATDSNDNLAGYSNYGQSVDLAAPGSGIYSTIPGASYGYSDGSSMAAPYVSGVAGLIKSLNPDDYRYEILKSRIINAVDKLVSLSSIYCRTGSAEICQVGSEGRLNAYRALYEGSDLVNPTLTLDNIFPGGVPQSFSGVLELTGSANDNIAVDKVEVKALRLRHVAKNVLSPNVADFDLFTAQGASSWSYNLDTTLLDNNYYYRLEIRAYDQAGNGSTPVSATIFVSN